MNRPYGDRILLAKLQFTHSSKHIFPQSLLTFHKKCYIIVIGIKPPTRRTRVCCKTFIPTPTTPSAERTPPRPSWRPPSREGWIPSASPTTTTASVTPATVCSAPSPTWSWTTTSAPCAATTITSTLSRKNTRDRSTSCGASSFAP